MYTPSSVTLLPTADVLDEVEPGEPSTRRVSREMSIASKFGTTWDARRRIYTTITMYNTQTTLTNGNLLGERRGHQDQEDG